VCGRAADRATGDWRLGKTLCAVRGGRWGIRHGAVSAHGQPSGAVGGGPIEKQPARIICGCPETLFGGTSHDRLLPRVRSRGDLGGRRLRSLEEAELGDGARLLLSPTQAGWSSGRSLLADQFFLLPSGSSCTVRHGEESLGDRE